MRSNFLVVVAKVEQKPKEARSSSELSRVGTRPRGPERTSNQVQQVKHLCRCNMYVAVTLFETNPIRPE